MINHTFFIVCRERDLSIVNNMPFRDRFGWEYVDGIEIFDWEEAKKLRKEYDSAFPSHTVLIRPKRIS